MNIQDIADFLDLVKNPAKYEALLKNITDRQAKLTETIENVAKATELDKLLKQNESRKVELESEYKALVEKQEKAHADLVAAAQTRKEEAQKLLEQVKQDVVNASQMKKEAEDNLRAAKQKSAEIAKQQQEVDEQGKKLQVLIEDYETKLTKFKQIVG